MKRAYEVKVEHGDNVYAYQFLVIAANDEAAVKAAKKQAATEGGPKTGWRCVSLVERDTQVIV